jgi:hypothetical protein
VFAIVLPSSITITSPNGGEELEASSVYPVTWTSTGKLNSLKIEYSTDNGIFWATIDSSVVNNGIYNWKVPEILSDNCLMRICEIDRDEGSSDTSDVVFSIIPASSPILNVVSPNGGEHLNAGSTHGITWTSTGGIENVKIEYSINNGNDWIGVIESTVNTGNYDWTVPDTVSDICLVRISESGNDTSDTGNTVFSIDAPSFLTVMSPNGGETLVVGSNYYITWTGTGIPGKVQIEFSTNNGSSWTMIMTAASNDSTNNSFYWTIPDTPSNSCLVRISGDDKDVGLSDLSDEVFSIIPSPSINLTSPNGGESLTAGSIYQITWTWTGSNSEIIIDYSIDNGVTWAYIGVAEANNGIYNWSVPGTPSNNCLVRIKGADKDEAPVDFSDSVFSII